MKIYFWKNLYWNALFTGMTVLIIGSKIYMHDFIVTFSSVFIRHNSMNFVIHSPVFHKWRKWHAVGVHAGLHKYTKWKYRKNVLFNINVSIKNHSLDIMRWSFWSGVIKYIKKSFGLYWISSRSAHYDHLKIPKEWLLIL